MEIIKDKISLRRATFDDCELLWNWVNDPLVRESAFCNSSISYDDHIVWCQKKINNPNCFIYIIQDEQENRVGQVRIDITSENEAEVDISIHDEMRGKGYGALALSATTEDVFNQRKIGYIHAFIRVENKSSQRIFEKSHFIAQGKVIIKNIEALHYLLERGTRS